MQQAGPGSNLSTKRTRKRECLAQMNAVVPWDDLVSLIAAYAPEGKRGRPPFEVETMLRVHHIQQWFTLSDPAMEEALHDKALFRDFALLGWEQRLPDENTILRFRHLLEKHKLVEQILGSVHDVLVVKRLLLKAGTVVDATLISAPSSTKNKSGERPAAKGKATCHVAMRPGKRKTPDAWGTRASRKPSVSRPVSGRKWNTRRG